MLTAINAPPPQARTKVLIVEDEGIVARDLKRRLEKQGFEISGIADNAVDALRLAVENPPDLALMDIIIQGDRDGIATALELRTRHDIPVVFLTAHSDMATIQRARSVLPYGYLVKPFEERELLTTIEMATYRHQTDARQRLYQRAISATTVGMLVTDASQPDLPIISCNAAFERISGYSEAEIIGRNPRFLQGPESDPESVRVMRDAVQAGRDCQVTLRNYRKDGTPFWCEVTISPVRDASGQLTHFIGVENDVTTQRQADEHIRHQAALIDQANDAICVFDLESRVTFWNPGAVRLYGFATEEVFGRPIMDSICREPAEKREAFIQEVFRVGHWNGEIRHQTKDGRALTVLSRLTLLTDAHGLPSGMLAVNHDLTETKALEQQLLRSQRQETLGALAGGIAHDLNNALAPILMGVELLKAKYPGAPGIVDLFDSSVRRAAAMIRQLLTFAKGTAGERSPVQLSYLIMEMQGIIESTFPKNITVQVHADSNLPTVLADATQLHQVLLNLCVNARDAMPTGGTLTLAATKVEVSVVQAGMPPNAKTGCHVAVSVRDTGTGIPLEIRERIFDPFFSTKAADKGTGLGLSTVMGIVKGHDGFLKVDSAPGQGTAFTAYLPAAISAAEAAPQTKWKMSFQGQGETILFVDDEPAVREVAREVLQRMNFRVVLASDGIEALMWLNEHQSILRAVITDQHMPNQDGLVFVSILKKILPDIPVIVSSGRLEDDMRKKFQALGVNAFLDKPCAEDQLAAVLHSIFAPA
ncbi:response regulator [Prosthecobacter sp.]|uniref:response regulator n=1 Tax=Prosthecobacter sp. TaxID=1965333 RepID=UPI002ABAA3D7|nr:response regulator [Prosthecobacter sp.]MDZ4405530.1 response regulator [Prosthecobacter sp.]